MNTYGNNTIAALGFIVLGVLMLLHSFGGFLVSLLRSQIAPGSTISLALVLWGLTAFLLVSACLCFGAGWVLFRASRRFEWVVLAAWLSVAGFDVYLMRGWINGKHGGDEWWVAEAVCVCMVLLMIGYHGLKQRHERAA
jgi:hypothetical protein